MNELKPCRACNLQECDFMNNGKDFVCSRGYILTAEDKQRILDGPCTYAHKPEGEQDGD